MPSGRAEGSGAERKRPNYDDDKQYEVFLFKSVEYPKGSGLTLIPEHRHYMLGSVLKELPAEVVKDATEVRDPLAHVELNEHQQEDRRKFLAREERAKPPSDLMAVKGFRKDPNAPPPRQERQPGQPGRAVFGKFRPRG